jgi:GT2 family glycosyltransferase
LLLGFAYLGRATAIRRDLVERLGGFRDVSGAEAYDLVLRATEETAAIRHVARPLWGETAAPESVEGERAAANDALERRHTPASVEALAPGVLRRLRRAVPAGSVSVVIPTRDRVDLLRVAVEGVRRTTRPDVEILIVDNDSSDPDTLGYLQSVDAIVIRFPGPFDFAAMNNLAARRARGEFLLFLNNDVEIHAPGWLEALLEYAALPEVGAVGARLLYPDGTLQHTGVLIQPDARTDHIVSGSREAELRHPYFPRVASDVAAVTAACMMVRRSVFGTAGGFDPELRVAYNDVDLCLRLRSLGYRVIFTPFCTLTHHECATRDPHPALAEEVLFRARWAGTELDGDPYLIPVCRTLGRHAALPKGEHLRSGVDRSAVGAGF